MTEREWLECDDAEVMLEHMRGKASDRKLRLLACASAARVCKWLPTKRLRDAIAVAERVADGLLTRSEFKQCRTGLQAHCFRPSWRFTSETAAHTIKQLLQPRAWNAAASVTDLATDTVVIATAPARKAAVRDKELGYHCSLLRDVFGNPFCPVSMPRSIYAWNDAALTRMANAIYDDRAFDQLALLADALEDAGCTDAAILGHCRGGGPHVRGCWVVDLLLGKS